MRRWRWGLLLLVAVVVAMPFYSANFLKGRLQAALERALNRSVRLEGEAHVRLFPLPAIVVEQVTIAEDPRFSLEPFAYVSEVSMEPSWTALLRGSLEAGRLRLFEPSVNLMRSNAGWNVQSMAGEARVFPDIEVRGGRLNFKQQDEKSAFYLANVLADISAPSRTGDVDVFLQAEPARTDRGPQGFGKFSLRGAVTLHTQKEADIDFQIELQPSALHAFNFFFGARSVDFAGNLSSRGRLHGALSRAQLEGWTQFEGLEEKGFLPFGEKSNRVEWQGLVDLVGQRFQLDSARSDNLRVRMRAREIFQAPRGAMLVEVRDVALEKLLDLTRQANLKLPVGVNAQGRFSGVLGYSLAETGTAVRGMIWFDQAVLQIPENPALKFGQASVIINGPEWVLGATEVRTEAQQSATLEAQWNSASGALRLGVATRLLGVNELRSGVGMLLRAAKLPLLQAARGGSWLGNLIYQRSEETDPGSWSGRLNLRNSMLSLDGLSVPLDVSTAQVNFDSSRVEVRRMRAQWDGDEIEGSYTYFPNATRASEFELMLNEGNLDRVGKVLQSAMEFPQGLLERMRLRRVPMPDWLRSRLLKGRLQFQEFDIGAGHFHPLALWVDWRGDKLELKFSNAPYSAVDSPEDALVEGTLHLQLFQADPRHVFRGKVRNWPSTEGPVTWQGRLDFRHFDARLWQDLRAEGSYERESGGEPAKFVWRDSKLLVQSETQKRSASPPRLWPLQLETEP